MESTKVSRKNHPSPFDVNLKVADTEIGAHRNILSGHSEYFHSLLDGSFKEASESEIDLTKVTSNVTMLEAVVDFMYTNEIDINGENVAEIVKLASYFCMENLQKICENFLLERLNKDTCLNYYLLGVDHGLKTIEEKSGIVLESRLHDYLITKDTLLTLSPPELKLIASRGFFKNCSLPRIVCFLYKWVEQGQSEEHLSVTSEMLENCIKDTDPQVDGLNDLKVDCQSAIKTLETCNVKPELCRKLEESLKQSEEAPPQEFEDVVLTISPRKNVVDKCMEAIRTKEKIYPKIHEKFMDEILDICLYVPARKKWYYLKSLKDDDGIHSKILRGMHSGYASGELYLGRFTLLKHYLFIALQNDYAPIHVIDLRDFSSRNIPFDHLFEGALQECDFQETYNYEQFSDICLTVGEDTLYMIINIMGMDQWWGEVTGYRQLVFKLQSDDSWAEVCNTSSNTDNYDDNNVYACVNDDKMLSVCRCPGEPGYIIIDLKCPNPSFDPEIESSPHVTLMDADLDCFADVWRLHFLRKGSVVFIVGEGTREEKEKSNLTTYSCSDVLKLNSKTFEICSQTEIIFGEKEKKRMEPCEYQMSFNDGKSIWNFMGDPAVDRSQMTEVYVGDDQRLEKREHIPPPFSSIINGAAGKLKLSELKLTPISEYFY